MQSAVAPEQVVHSAASSLFVVPHGISRIAEGRRQAVPLLSRSPQEADLVRRGAHPDLIELCPAKGKVKIGIDQVRQVIHQAQFAPTQAAQKVCLVPRAEDLTPEAANALLKVLEEPPRGLIFLFLVEHPGDLLPTIVSRSRVIRIRPTTNEELLARLTEAGYGASEARHLIDVVADESELNELIGHPIDLATKEEEAVASVSSARDEGLVAYAIGDDPIVRHAAVTSLLARFVTRDLRLITLGARMISRAGSDAAHRLLAGLLTAVFAALPNVHQEERRVTPLPTLHIDVRRGLRLCQRIARAQRAVERYTPLEAVFLSLFLSVCEVRDD